VLEPRQTSTITESPEHSGEVRDIDQQAELGGRCTDGSAVGRRRAYQRVDGLAPPEPRFARPAFDLCRGIVVVGHAGAPAANVVCGG
jgi:hypothetical protein